jgi:hypothetical protein
MYHLCHVCYMSRPSHPSLTILGEAYVLWSLSLSVLFGLLQFPLRRRYSPQLMMSIFRCRGLWKNIRHSPRALCSISQVCFFSLFTEITYLLTYLLAHEKTENLRFVNVLMNLEINGPIKLKLQIPTNIYTSAHCPTPITQYEPDKHRK